MESYDIGRVFSRLFNMVVQCIWPTAGFIIVGILAMFAAMFLAFGSIFSAMFASIGSSPAARAEAVQQAMSSVMIGGVGLAVVALVYIGMLLIGSFLFAGVVDACLRSGRGETPSFSSCVSAGASNFLKLAGFFLLWYIALAAIVLILAGLGGLIAPWFGGLIASIAALVYLALFSPSIPALINEPATGVFAAFGRGFSLTSKNLGMVILTLVLWVVAYIVLAFAFGLIVVLFGGILGMISQYLLVVLVVPYIAFYVAILIFVYGSMATIYAELTLIHEGGDSNSIADVFA